MKKSIARIVLAIVFIVVLPLSVYAHVVCQPGMCDWHRTSNQRVSVAYKSATQHTVTEREREQCSICGDIRTTRTIYTDESHDMHIVTNEPKYQTYTKAKHYKITPRYNKCKYCSRGEKLADLKTTESHSPVKRTVRDKKDKNKVVTRTVCSKCGAYLD